MNAFKFGQVGKGKEGMYSADAYIKTVTEDGKAFQPQQKSTVFYPASYKEIYSLQGEFAQIMSEVFSVSGIFDAKSKITAMSLEVKS